MKVSQQGGVRRKGFWASIWGKVDMRAAGDQIELYHSETVRQVLALDGRPADWARVQILQDEENALSLSDKVYKDCRVNVMGALTGAIYARRQSYVAVIHGSDYDEVSESDCRAYFRRCQVRAEHEMAEWLENGLGVELGRPD